MSVCMYTHRIPVVKFIVEWKERTSVIIWYNVAYVFLDKNERFRESRSHSWLGDCRCPSVPANPFQGEYQSFPFPAET